MEQTTENLTQYLKTASELESSIYRQEEVLEKAEAELVYEKPEYESIPAPVDASKKLTRPNRPSNKVSETNEFGVQHSSYIPIIVASFALAALAIFLAFALNLLGIIAVGIVFAVFGVLYIWVYRSGVKRAETKVGTDREKYEHDLEAYESEYKAAKSKYEKDMAKYREKVKERNDRLEKETAVAKQQYQEACEEVQLLKPPLTETKELLSRLYSNEWIFPKYRNMVAMATMYEYFASGRCSELTGPNGAYNLYEQELRQNLIINKLDVISSQLEDIKDNQYVLYTEMKKTNQYLGEITQTVKDINKGVRVTAANTGEIAKSAKVAAYYSEITAKNTEALKYIELVTQ